jgi:hypothetical protein
MVTKYMVTKLAFEFGQLKFVVASGAFQGLELGQIFEMRNLRVLSLLDAVRSFRAGLQI